MTDQTIVVNISGIAGGFFVVARYCGVRHAWAGYAHHFEPAAFNAHELQETIDALMQQVTGERHFATAAAAIGAAVTVLLEAQGWVTPLVILEDCGHEAAS